MEPLISGVAALVIGVAVGLVVGYAAGCIDTTEAAEIARKQEHHELQD